MAIVEIQDILDQIKLMEGLEYSLKIVYFSRLMYLLWTTLLKVYSLYFLKIKLVNTVLPFTAAICHLKIHPMDVIVYHFTPIF